MINLQGETDDPGKRGNDLSTVFEQTGGDGIVPLDGQSLDLGTDTSPVSEGSISAWVHL